MKTVNLKKVITDALAEDQVKRDVTSNLLIPKNHVSRAEIVTKEEGVLCGVLFAKAVFNAVDPAVKFQCAFTDGDKIKKGQTVIRLKGKTRSLLAAERTALNFLGYLSGISTTTRRFVDEVKPFKAKILGTRKTTPGNRMIEKYAIRVGGGLSHRLGLSDMVLIKDNHRFVYREFISLHSAIDRFKQKIKKNIPIEVEVDDLSELQEALKSNPDMILLDNMSPRNMRRAVEMVKASRKKPRPLLEASGGITYNNVREVAQTGVDRISTGALTHHQQWLNFSLDFIK